MPVLQSKRALTLTQNYYFCEYIFFFKCFCFFPASSFFDCVSKNDMKFEMKKNITINNNNLGYCQLFAHHSEQLVASDALWLDVIMQLIVLRNKNNNNKADTYLCGLLISTTIIYVVC